MKVILYMAISANGLIAKDDDGTGWISEEEWDSYDSMVRKVGCLIVGYKTYRIITDNLELPEWEKLKVAVVSSKNRKTISKNHFVVHSPKQALELLKDYEEVIVAGGSTLNAAFLCENLVDEMYLDIEPIVFGKGMNLFAKSDFEAQMELLGMKLLAKNLIQLHYKVLH